MIVDVMENASRYAEMNPLFSRAFAFMRDLTLDTMPKEKLELDSSALYVVPQSRQGVRKQEAVLEDHRRYIDIHYLLDGHEQIGWMPASFCQTVTTPYNEKDDYILYGDVPDLWIPFLPRDFCVFWPGEAHAPAVSEGRITKVVIKVLAA